MLSIAAIMLVFAFFVYFGFKILGMESDVIHAMPGNNTLSNSIIDKVNSQYPAVFDKGALLFFIALPLISMFLAYQVNSNPGLMIFSVLLLLVVVVITAVMSNMWSDFNSAQEFNTFADHFPFMNWFLSHLVEYVVIMGLGIAFALAAKRPESVG